MTDETGRDRIRRLQREWAEARGLAVDAKDNLADYRQNLRTSLSKRAVDAFSIGATAELVDSANGGPAKMRALYSSAALAVNVFDYWLSHDADPLLRALRVNGKPMSLEFEAPLRTGYGTPPQLDVLIRLSGGGLVGIESKFTDWMTKKSKQAEKLSPYFQVDGSSSYWSRAGLAASHQLAKSILHTPDTYQVLEVPQLLKHALGLHKAAGQKPWSLLYLYFAGSGDIARTHDDELARFTAAVGHEVHCSVMTYQALFASIERMPSDVDPEYVAYLRERYFAGGK